MLSKRRQREARRIRRAKKRAELARAQDLSKGLLEKIEEALAAEAAEADRRHVRPETPPSELDKIASRLTPDERRLAYKILRLWTSCAGPRPTTGTYGPEFGIQRGTGEMSERRAREWAELCEIERRIGHVFWPDVQGLVCWNEFRLFGLVREGLRRGLIRLNHEEEFNT